MLPGSGKPGGGHWAKREPEIKEASRKSVKSGVFIRSVKVKSEELGVRIGNKILKLEHALNVLQFRANVVLD